MWVFYHYFPIFLLDFSNFFFFFFYCLLVFSLCFVIVCDWFVSVLVVFWECF